MTTQQMEVWRYVDLSDGKGIGALIMLARKSITGCTYTHTASILFVSLFSSIYSSLLRNLCTIFLHPLPFCCFPLHRSAYLDK